MSYDDKKRIISNMSPTERDLLLIGELPHGLRNSLTNVFVLIGKHDELMESGRLNALLAFDPTLERHFRLENRGQRIVKKNLAKKGFDIPRYLYRHASRAWIGVNVKVSFELYEIVNEAIGIVMADDYMAKVYCERILTTQGNASSMLAVSFLPTQHEFLSRRALNGYKHSEKARYILGEIANNELYRREAKDDGCKSIQDSQVI